MQFAPQPVQYYDPNAQMQYAQQPMQYAPPAGNGQMLQMPQVRLSSPSP